METYFIHEDNIERLEKKINFIRNKCVKNNLTFTYNIGEPEFRNIAPEGEPEIIARYYPVQVEGSIKHADWTFAATIDHASESGNIVRAYLTDVEIPEKYYTCGPTCEHCNKIRSRKDTYLIYNTATQAFKQVGKSCMQEYTNGLDAEEVARYISLFDEMIKGYAPSGCSHKQYKSIEELLQYSFECVKHFGYHNSDAIYSTRSRVLDYIYATKSSCPETIRCKVEAEKAEVGFDINSEDTLKNVADSLNWIRNEVTDTCGYLFNLRIACEEDYIESRNTGLAISLPVAYFKHIEKLEKDAKYAAEKKAEKAIESQSTYQGEIGQRITIVPESATCVSSFNNLYGTTWLYKFLDAANNVYIWYASNPIDSDKDIDAIVGTVKDHLEFRDVKQTVLTRCKVTYSSSKPEEVQEHPEGHIEELYSTLDMLFEN